MKKSKMVVNLLAVADVCIEASEARARLHELSNKGPSKKKQQEDREVNAVDRGDHGNCGNYQQQPTKQKEKRSFGWPADAEKWSEIHRTAWHNLEECKTFLDHKKMLEKPVVQEPQRGEHRQAGPDNEYQMDEIIVIFVGSLSITSNTQGKKLEREIILAQSIEPERRMKWSEDHPLAELSNWNLPFVVKLPIGRHKVAKTLVDNGASLNLFMRKTFNEMGLNLSHLTLVHDTFHGVIPGQSSTPIRRIDLEVSCGSGDNKRREMLMLGRKL
jgi:hypothetical protein